MPGKKTSNSNVVPFPKGAQKAQQNLSRPCSFKATSDNGNIVYGTAAFLVVAKRNGGINAYVQQVATTAATNALQDAINAGATRPKSG